MDQKEFLRIENGVLIGYEDIPENTETLIIPEGVTAIGKEAFANCKYSQIIIPDSVESIEAGAFCECYYLESIVLPKKLRVIPEDCFVHCYALSSVDLPETLEEIGDAAFCECINLRFCELPETLEIIGDEAFFHCEFELKRLPANLKHIGAYAFAQEYSYISNGRIEEISFSEDLQEIQEGSFQFCSLKSLRLPFGLKRIGKKAFKGVCQLTTVVLPDHLEEIDDEAFYGSSLTRITFPRDLRRIGKAAFAESGKLEWVVFRDGLQEIDDGAFKGCPLRKLLLKRWLRRIGAHAFEGCKTIRYVKFSPNLQDIGENAFLGCPMTDTRLPPEIKRFAGKAAIKDGSRYVARNIVEYLSSWTIVRIITELLARNHSVTIELGYNNGGYSISIGESNVGIEICDNDSETNEYDDMYFVYHFSAEEFLQIMNELRNIQVSRHRDKTKENTFVDTANRLYDELADYLHGLSKQNLQDTSSQ